MRNQSILKKLLALAVCMAVLLAGPVPYGVAALADSDYSDELADLNSQYDELKKKQDAVQQQINQASNDKAAALAKKRNLNNQISLTQQQISVLEEKIAVLEENIAEKEEEIAELEEKIAQSYNQYKQRLAALYRAGNPTALGVVLGAANFSDFLMQSEMLKRMADHDQTLLDGLAANKEELEEKRAELNSEKEEQDASKAEVESLKNQLNNQLSKTNTQIHNITALEAELQADKAAFQAKMAAIQAEIDDIYSQIQSSGDYVGGQLAWPVPGFRTITSEFGWRFGGSDYHTGFDISGSGVNGKSIVAANSGTVVYVKYGTSGYGRYLIVDHGGGYTTLYAHCSEIMVEVGEYVSRGQAIAKVGSTGWSTGPHLHFEVRVNGVAKNPRSYYSV
ncbi:MAG: peptidoglycan DD-metalloendopeptidase family protein [Oscillospiraceae bacterium]|nr:peptidoglycan DD-metalloendopeptidase family protein [Oscillospiraceae bacterium]